MQKNSFIHYSILTKNPGHFEYEKDKMSGRATLTEASCRTTKYTESLVKIKALPGGSSCTYEETIFYRKSTSQACLVPHGASSTDKRPFQGILINKIIMRTKNISTFSAFYTNRAN